MASDETAASFGETLAPTDAPRPQRQKRLPGLDGRYVDLGPLAAGGMGELHRIRDTRFGRVIVLKVLRPELAQHVEALRRFEHEARITALLEHPGVVAVHDRGRLWDGRPWFAMQEVRGRTLRQLIQAIHTDENATRFGTGIDGWTFRRLVGAIARVSRTVAYAHERRIVHRDLKPDNIMVGAFGEVLVMDWGIAWEISDEPPQGVMGTPAFMPPEQALGEPIGPSADVYALGATLYALLGGVPPYQTRGGVIEGPPPPVRGVNPERKLPDALIAICELAMARDAAERPSADAFAQRLEDWLDGVERREKALKLIAAADALRPEVEALHAASAALTAEAQAALAALPLRAPVEDKYPAWAKEDSAKEKARAAELADVEYLQTLRGALNLVEDLPEARARLADHHKRAMERAEQAGRVDAVARSEALLRAYDDGQHAEWLAGDGAVTLHTDPSGAAVTLYAVVERHRRRVLEEVRGLGITPLDAEPLPRGNWVLRIHHPERMAVDYPVKIERGEHWDGVAPDEDVPTPIYLPKIGELGEAERYVPAGWFTAGGDPMAPDGLSRRRIWVDGFVMARDPVTHGEYLAFLQAMVDAEGEGALQRLAPRGNWQDDEPLCAVEDGTVVYSADPAGRIARPETPVVRVNQLQAVAYLEWQSAQLGRSLALPHEFEWEKAARGVDQRIYAWGDHFDPNWTWVLSSQTGVPWLCDVAECDADRSPYGVRGLTGNVRDWCRNPYIRGGEFGPRIAADDNSSEPRIVRGGSWNSVDTYCRLGARFGARADRNFAAGGFRWVCVVPFRKPE